MDSEMKKFLHDYYNHVYPNNLDLIGANDLPSGGFDRYTLGVNFSGIDAGYVEKIKKMLSNLEKSSLDVSTSKTTTSIVSDNPEIISMIIGQELMSHE